MADEKSSIKNIEAPQTVVYILKVGNLPQTTFPIVNEKGKKIQLTAINGRIELDKKADKETIALVDEYIKGNINSPLVKYDEFQASLMSEPIKIEIDGKYYELSKEAIINAVKDSEELDKIKKKGNREK